MPDERRGAALRFDAAAAVWMGAESGSQKVLDAMEKGTTIDDIRSATAHLRAAGIEACFFLQFPAQGRGRGLAKLDMPAR